MTARSAVDAVTIAEDAISGKHSIRRSTPRRYLIMLPSILTRSTIVILSAILAPAAFQANRVAAQGNIPGHRARVTVALVDTLPRLREAFVAVIVRSPGASGHDVILLPRGTASGQLLDEATRVLLDARVRQGDRPSALHGKAFQRLMIGVRGKASSSSMAAFHVASAQHIVDYLQQASPREIPGVGKAPAVDFIPPVITSRGGNE